MKILNLDLIAYGLFTGESLNFRDGSANLHILYGPNEAGKSCTLRALSNALFGIPDARDAFLHPYDDLRIGLTLESREGVIKVIRRKGRANSLRRNDGSDSIFQAEEWTALLPVKSREAFDRMFGVDHAEIARGGKLLLSSSSDLGAMLFAAAGGVERLRNVQGELSEAAEKLFKKSGSKPEINKAASDLKAALKSVRESLLLVTEYKQQRDALEEVESQSRQLEEEIRETSLEEQRLTRMKQSFPLVAQRKQRIEQLKQHELSPSLAADFAERYRQAHDALRRAEAEAASHLRDIEILRTKIEAAPIASGILMRDKEIDLLYKQSAVVKKGADDRVRRQQTLEDARAETVALLKSIGVTMTLEQAAELRVSEAAQKRIFVLGTNKKAVDQDVAASERELGKAREELRRATEELARLVATTDTAGLEEALSTVPPGRDLEEELSRLSNECSAATSGLERGVLALPDWRGSVEALAAAPVPLAETIAQFQDRFQRHEAEATRLRDEELRLATERDQATLDLRKIAQEQAIPTEHDLESSRAGRDTQWQTIRRAWLETLEVDGAGLASSFESSVSTSDQIADRLRREAKRVSEKTALLVNLDRLGEKLAALEVQKEAEQRATAELQAEWESRWSAAMVSPGTPAEMQGWLRQRETLLAQYREVQRSRGELTALENLIGESRRALLSKLATVTGESVDVATPLSELVRKARKAVSDQGAIRQRHATLHADVQRLSRVTTELEQHLGNATNSLASWKREWSDATEKLPVRRDASPDEVQVVVELIKSLIAKIDEIGKLEDRIGKLSKDEAEFTDKVSLVLEAVGAGSKTREPFAAIAELNAELQKNRTGRDLLSALIKQLEDKQKLLQNSEDQVRSQRALLVDLCSEAGATDPATLPDCIEKASDKRRLNRELSDVEDNLTSFTAGGTIDQLVIELDGLNLDHLPNQITELQQKTEALRKQKAECDQSLGEYRLRLKLREDADSAGHAAEEAEFLRARIATLAEQYVRLRLASRILANTVERFRDRNQGPLLKTAAELFRQLTDDSFHDLRVDWNEEGEAVLMGIRGVTQKQIGIEGMSEATRDQLFLALRLAYVLNYCDAHGPVPFIADDVLMTFDDVRAAAALKALETLSRHTQVLLFTHHQHHVDLARASLTPDAYRVHLLG